ncbi:MAG TPA: nucleotidyltransferase domain-containing protein [Rhodospirillales bacterium]|nr:nucleotidyltransferase domain-containing protein [Rhodospirillales bacterium]
MDQAMLERERARYRAALEQAVERLRTRFSALPEVERVSLFGSYARGRRDLLTDLDVLVVMRTDEPFLERLRRLHRLAGAGVDLDILCYTPTEFARMKTRPFLRHALKDEVVLYEKPARGGS